MTSLAPRAPASTFRSLLHPALLVAGLVLGLVMASLPARAADRARIEAFLQITGFDVALDSIAETAESAPAMLGVKPGSFGTEWTRLATQVFDTAVMRDLAMELLEPTLKDDWLAHASEFYASDLGQRLVAAENASHIMDDDEKKAEGTRRIAGMRLRDDPRLPLLEKMNATIGGEDSSLRALQEVQFRFLLAASAAGVVELRTDADGLRAALARNADKLRGKLRESALIGAAYTYRDFTDAEIEVYTAALATPEMQKVYELLNAIQFEIMANRFEVLAARMAGLRPGEDI